MDINLIAVGTRMPGWVNDAYQEYARRLPRECSLKLVEIPLGSRAKSKPVETKAKTGAKRRKATSRAGRSA